MGKKGGELTKTERVHRMYEFLMDGEAISTRWYKDEFGTSRKTMLRDLDELRNMNLDLIEDFSGNGVRYSVDLDTRKVIVPHTMKAVMALFLGRRMFDFLAGTTLEDSFNEAYRAIEKQLKSKNDIDNAHKLSQKLYLVHEGPKQYTEDIAETVENILYALRYERTLEVEYESAAGVTHEIEIQPYTLVAFKRGLYLLGAVPSWNGALFRFAIERFSDVEITPDTFIYPRAHNPETFFESALFMDTGPTQKVTLLFSKGSDTYIGLRQYHPSQQIVQKRDGRIQMTLDVHPGYELIHWILSFGANVEVVSPKKLRQQVADGLKSALAIYQ